MSKNSTCFWKGAAVLFILVGSAWADSAPGSTFARSPLRPFNYPSYDRDIRTNDFVVLDVNFEKRLAAFRHVYQQLDISQDGIPATADCGYAGMAKLPHSGVVLGVYDLKRGVLKKHFVIYRAVTGKGECTKREESEAALAEAKAYIKQLGLNVKAQPTAYRPNAKGEFVPTLGGRSALIATASRRVTEHDWANDPALTAVDRNDSVVSSITIGEAKAEGRVIYRSYYGDSWSMGSKGYVEFLSLFAERGEFVFLERFRHRTGHFDMTDFEVYHFSPVLSIPTRNTKGALGTGTRPVVH
jgi:hypothetical protein